MRIHRFWGRYHQRKTDSVPFSQGDWRRRGGGEAAPPPSYSSPSICRPLNPVPKHVQMCQTRYVWPDWVPAHAEDVYTGNDWLLHFSYRMLSAVVAVWAVGLSVIKPVCFCYFPSFPATILRRPELLIFALTNAMGRRGLCSILPCELLTCLFLSSFLYYLLIDKYCMMLRTLCLSWHSFKTKVKLYRLSVWQQLAVAELLLLCCLQI